VLTPDGAEFYNPAFDVTPAHLIAAILTEEGAIAPAKLTEKLGA
jgi:methylthioribose-1-phosphate isomerase